MDSIDTPNNYTVLFVIKSKSYSEFMTNVLDIEYVEDNYYSIMDPEGKFLENNKDIPRWIIESSILIGPQNKIKMVGSPFSTPKHKTMNPELKTHRTPPDPLKGEPTIPQLKHETRNSEL